YSVLEPGAVVLVAQNGIPVYRKAFGMASLELAVPLKEDHVFAIGSMTKQFTGVCILQLAQEGKLHLQDNINKYLPDYNTHGRKITIEHLLTHTSGIPGFTELDTFASILNKDVTPPELLALFQEEELLFEPGSDWSYSNSGYNVAGVIIEKVSGMKYEDYLQKKIFDPLHMTSTTTGSKNKIIPRMVNGYSPGAASYSPAREFSWTWPFAAGMIVSNVDDLLKWDEALYTNKILNEEYRKIAFQNYVLSTGDSANYGYGWAIGNFEDKKIIRHGGAIDGFLSDAMRIPSAHLYIAILTNNTKQSPVDITNEIANTLLNLGINASETALNKKEMEDFAGTYALRRLGGRLVSNYSAEPMYRYITIEEDGLYSQRTGGSKNKLTYVGNDAFTFGNKFTRLLFLRHMDNSIKGLMIYDVLGGYGPNDIALKTHIPLPAAKTEIALSADILKKYEGKYDFGGGFFMQIFVKDKILYGQATGQGAIQLYAESETKFFLKIVDATIEFHVNETGVVESMTLFQGKEMKAMKVE
ncbi:MAG: serine hydrolase, partial [Chitinophagales bacterium]